MNIIEKIEIKHFRSFDGGKDQEKVKIDNLKDLNIFSGANDSGKSNVLRALNLFFNNEISPGTKFDKNRDFSKIASVRFDLDIEDRRKAEKKRISAAAKKGIEELPKILRRSDEVVTVKLFFHNAAKQRGLPEKFWVSRTYSQKNSFSGQYIFPDSLNSSQATQFVKSFKYEYVPAIKDKEYFNHLFEKLQTYLFEKEDKSKGNIFSKSSSDFNDLLKRETKEIFDQFQRSSGVDANFHIPSTLVDFFRTLSVRTENDISLFDRGDGVQARFIPEILDQISKNSKKNIIWGFEEPENSYEAKNIRKIRDDFIDRYSRDKQIFITSHTKEFLAVKRRLTKQEIRIYNESELKTKTSISEEIGRLKSKSKSSDISIYRVWRTMATNYCSHITRFDENNSAWEDTCDDLGLVLEARIIEALQEKLNSQAEDISKSNLTLEKQKKVSKELNDTLESYILELDSAKSKIEEYKKPILVVEDKYDDIYKISYLKIKGIDFDKSNLREVFYEYSPFTIRRAESAGSVAGNLRMNNTDGYEDKSIIGLFDFDREGSLNFRKLKDANNWDEDILGDQKSGFYKKRNQHQCFYALLIPIPERHKNLVNDIKAGCLDSLIEIENLLPDNVLLDNQLAEKKVIYGQSYLKVKSNVKSKISEKLIPLDKGEFSDFIPLFSKIENLFEIDSVL